VQTPVSAVAYVTHNIYILLYVSTRMRRNNETFNKRSEQRLKK